jgi:hypothetical protein
MHFAFDDGKDVRGSELGLEKYKYNLCHGKDM